MTRYAKIDENNIVESVILCEDSQIVNFTGNYVKESLETKQADVGDTWDQVNNKFIEPKPYESWTLDENFDWRSPVEKLVPNSYWSEEDMSWIITNIASEE
jgi:hypothetical protein